MKTLIVLALMTASVSFNSEKALSAEGFELRWEHQAAYVKFTLSAPTVGWVALGFTKGQSIMDTNLIQGAMRHGKVVIEDQFVTGFGEHPPVEKLGAKSQIFDLSGTEKKGMTTLTFSISKKAIDKYHYDLREGKEINIWLAYSVSDDFDHHSRKRIMRTIEL